VLGARLLDLLLCEGLLGCQLLRESRLADLALQTPLPDKRLELRCVYATRRCLDCGLLLSALVTQVAQHAELVNVCRCSTLRGESHQSHLLLALRLLACLEEELLSLTLGN
jgi:hypothetical protein